MSLPKSPVTQRLRNEFPPESDVRTDEQSVGAQLLNIAGNHLQDLHEQLQTLGKNYTIGQANLKDIDVVYRFELPGTFEFELSNDDELNPEFATPAIMGLQNGTWYPVSLPEENILESFWYDSLPNRITSEEFEVTNIIVDSDTFIGCIMNDTVENSPIDLTGTVIDEPATKLWVQTIGGTQYIGLDDTQQVFRGMITITGLTRKGLEETETLIFLHDNIIQTSKEWASVYKVEMSNITPASTKVRIFTNRFGIGLTPPPLDWYNLDVSQYTKQNMDTFWDINNDVGPTLQMKQYTNHDIRDRIAGFIDTEVVRQFNLNLDENVVIDLAIEPFSHRIWILTADNLLYVYDDENPLPSMKVLDKKQSDAMSVLSMDKYHVGNGLEEIQVSYIIRRPIIELIRHRVILQSPSGTKFNIIDGSLTAFDNTAWVYGKASGRYIRPTDIFTFDEEGSWIWTLECKYINNVTEIDQRITTVDHKTSLTTPIDLSSVHDGEIIPLGIDFDSDQNLWFAYSVGESIYKSRIDLHTDTMLIDYNNKIIFFKEEYDLVKVD